MELPGGNFFEVTVNSEKLFSYIQSLHSKITQQQTKVTDHQKMITNLEKSIWEKLDKKIYDLSIQMERRKRENQEELNHFKLLMKDHDKKAQKKLHEFQCTVSMLNNRIISVKESLQAETCLKLSYMEKRLQNTLNSQQLQSIINEHIGKLNKHFQQLSKNQKQALLDLQEKVNFNSQQNQSFIQKQSEWQKQRRHVTLNCPDGFMSHRKVSTQKRAKTQRKGTIHDNHLDMQAFVVRIQEIQAKINTKASRRVKTQKRVNFESPDVAKEEEEEPVKEQKGGLKESSRLILQRLNQIADAYTAKMPQFEQKLGKFHNKYEIINQQIGILSRKVDKERSQITQIRDGVKRIDDKRIDEKVIQNLKNMLKQIGKQLEDGLKAKVDKQSFQRERMRINQKISRTFNIVDDKCDKTQVKKGLTFLEDKIKDLIMVLDEQRNLTKEGAIKKMQVNCLSCDKQLESTLKQNHYQHRSLRNSLNSTSTISRCSANHLRRRRVVNSNLVED